MVVVVVVGIIRVDTRATTLVGEPGSEVLGLGVEVEGSGLGQPLGDCWATCLVTETRDTGDTIEDGEEEDTTEAGEAGAEAIIEAGVEEEPQLDFLGDPRPPVEPGRLRDLVGRGGDRLELCQVFVVIFLY